MNRRYYSFEIQLISPLSIGSGLNNNTDSDVLLDSGGKPYIPATSIAGVLASKLDLVTKERIFGKISPDGECRKSHVIFYDAVYASDRKAVLSVRDSVALENRVAKSGAKFDFEIVEPGICFKTYVEFDDFVSGDDEDVVLHQLSLLDKGVLRFGHKTTRGYGLVRLKNIQRQMFCDISEWLDFDMYEERCWEKAEAVSLPDSDETYDTILLSLELKSALSVRSYTTELPAEANDDKAPDYKYLSLIDGRPVIPGTSWAGVFRDRFKLFRGRQAADNLFGMIVPESDIKIKSRVSFSESIFEPDTYEKKLVTRNSIDRFSAGTNDGALYTELTVYGGKTTLLITIPSETEDCDKAALLAVVSDLDNGLVSVGGLTSVGRGIFNVTGLKYNGEERTEEFKSYKYSGVYGGKIV